MKNKHEEAQGLTEKMVTCHLNATGWSGHMDQKRFILKPWDIWIDLNDMERSIDVLAGIAKCTPQALLRTINPRLRKGCPSQAARSAHPGHWLAVDPVGRGFLVRFDERRGDDPGFEVYRSSGDGRPQNGPFHDPGCSYNVSDFRGGLAAWSFWPADDSANKVPWPEKDGVML